MSLLGALESLGLAQIEALSYAFLAGSSPTTGYKVARGIGKPTANVYRALESLERKGLVVQDRGTPPAYRALPPDDMLARLEREFLEKKARAARELAALKPGVDDEKLYALKLQDQVIARAHLLLAAARRVVLMEAPTASLVGLESALDDARSRGIRVVIVTDHQPAVPHDDSIVSERRAIKATRMVADARDSLISTLPNDAGGVREAIWTRSPLVGRMLHDALVSEVFYGLVERSLEDGISVDEVEDAFERCRRIRESL
ncbi:MAG TPA: helix-turn-helix domain-containing protein [Candidatus Krumholzibacteria bacterium]|nr:helix-turn-helix domain-containing protein [Candidatus Krumholzibacteria bacterium]